MQSAVQFLAGSTERPRLLEHLREHPGSPSEVADALSLSGRSVQRTLREFTDRGWARRGEGGYELTTLGALVASEHADYAAAVDRLGEYRSLYEHLPDPGAAPDPRWLADADVALSTPEDPQAPVNFYVTRLRRFDADEIRMTSPVLSRIFHDAHAELVVSGAHTELVLSAEMVEAARSRNPAEFEVVVAVDLLSLYRHPGPVEVGLTVGEDRALVAAYDDEGQLRACLDSADPRLVEWASERYREYRDRAERVEPSGLPFVG